MTAALLCADVNLCRPLRRENRRGGDCGLVRNLVLALLSLLSPFSELVPELRLRWRPTTRRKALCCGLGRLLLGGRRGSPARRVRRKGLRGCKYLAPESDVFYTRKGVYSFERKSQS